MLRACYNYARQYVLGGEWDPADCFLETVCKWRCVEGSVTVLVFLVLAYMRREAELCIVLAAAGMERQGTICGQSG